MTTLTLGRRTARIVPLGALTATVVATFVGTVLAARRWPGEPEVVVVTLRLTAMMLAVSLAFTWDDPAADTLAPSPRPLIWRRGMRLAVTVPVIVVGWLAAVPAAHAAAGEPFIGMPYPDGGITVELVGLSALGLAVSGWASRSRRSHPGTIAAVTLVGVAMGLRFVPERWSMLAGAPGSPNWDDAHLRWATLSLVAVLSILWFSRDPASRLPVSGRWPAAVSPQGR